MADEQMDFFLFLGEPKDILNEYTNITGKSPMLPLWSFGTWMSRITYFSQEEGLEIARQLRANKIPSDVIHFDTGWFGVDWQCDYQFAKDRFKDPVKMLKQFAKDGFHTCLWQLPYFTPKNRFFPEIIAKGMHVVNAAGGMPVEDAVLDFSNPETVSWYQQKIEGLLKQGVSTIKCDFGEAAPYNGFYHSGKGGLYEHNLYPLRYNKALWEVVERNHPGEGIIWARSAWGVICEVDFPSDSAASLSGVMIWVVSSQLRQRTSIAAGCLSASSVLTRVPTVHLPRNPGSSQSRSQRHSAIVPR